MSMIHPVILSGGMGSRLWPMSRKQQPKQFQPIDGPGSPSFLQATVSRHLGDGYGAPLVVGAAQQVDLLDRQLREIGVDARVLAEPVGRNTGPAVLAAALDILESDPDGVLLVLPSDHVIDGALDGAVGEMRLGADDGWICMLGIHPNHPETGFGYISSGDEIAHCPGLRRVRGFVEKPDHDRATALIAEGASWSSGISAMRAATIIEEFARHHPDTLAAVRAARDGRTEVAGVAFLAEEPFSHALDAPTESAIFERSQLMAVARTDVRWNDVGAWTAVHEIGRKSDNGNVESGEVLSINTHGSLIRAEDRLVAVIGMDGVIIVDTPDALLVTNHANAQKVKQAVTQLREQSRAEVEHHRLPAAAPELDAMKQLKLEPGHAGQVEGGEAGCVVTVAAGSARVKLPDGPGDVVAGEVFTLPAGHVARLWNPGDTPLVLFAIAITPSEPAEPRPGSEQAQQSHCGGSGFKEAGRGATPRRNAGPDDWPRRGAHVKHLAGNGKRDIA